MALNILLTTPKLKISDLGVISPRKASGAIQAAVPTTLSVMMVCVNVTDALASPKSEILGTYVSVNKIFALVESGEKRKINFPNQ